MKLKKILILIVSILLFSTMQFCTPESDYGSITTSTAGSNNSHNVGQNCMNCHNGSGEAPLWKVAGTVYNQALTATNPTTTVKLYTGPDGTGTLKYSINVDAKGNFYTSSNIDFTGGLYPSVVGSSTTSYMSSSITNGACNSCHNGVTRTRIWN